MLVHAIKLVEDEIALATEYNIEVNRNCRQWLREFQIECIDELKTKYKLTCDVTFSYNINSIQFLDNTKYNRVEINDKGIEIGNLRSNDPNHKILFDNITALLYNYSNIQEDLNVYNSRYKVGYEKFKFKQTNELSNELSKLKRAYERSTVDNIINSGKDVVIDEIIYELKNTFDRVLDTNDYIYELREKKDKTIAMNAGAGKWDKYHVSSIQVLKENKGGKTYQVKCKGSENTKDFIIDRLKKDYLIYAIGSILTLNKHSKVQFDEFNALKESEKRIKDIN